jgi:hypothetical protein
MINPYQLKVYRVKYSDRARGTKGYCASFENDGNGFAKVSRVKHKTASGAMAHGINVLIRLRRLYDASIAEMIKTEPTA